MSLLERPLPPLQLNVPSAMLPPGEARHTSAEFGWFDIDSLLTAGTSMGDSSFSGSEQGGDELVRSGEDSVLPPALRHVFDWLEEVEGHYNVPRVDEDILAAHAFLSLETSCSPSRKNGDKVVATSAITKTDFCLTSRDQPSLAVGVYAYRVMHRPRWLFWPECYAEHLVVIGTERELLRGWRCYSDFASLAKTAKKARARKAVKYWTSLDRATGGRRKTEPANLKSEARHLSQFLTTLVEELEEKDIGVLTGLIRSPTTYVIVGIENMKPNSDDGDHQRGGGSDTKTVKDMSKPASQTEPVTGGCNASSSSIAGGIRSEIRNPINCKRWESPIKPQPQLWDGL